MVITYDRDEDVIPEKHIHKFNGYQFKLVVERINVNCCKVYFINSVDFPMSISGNRVRCMSDNVQQSEIKIDGIECFLICWMDDYEFYYDDAKIFSLHGQRRHLEVNHDAEVNVHLL